MKTIVTSALTFQSLIAVILCKTGPPQNCNFQKCETEMFKKWQRFEWQKRTEFALLVNKDANVDLFSEEFYHQNFCKIFNEERQNCMTRNGCTPDILKEHFNTIGHWSLHRRAHGQNITFKHAPKAMWYYYVLQPRSDDDESGDVFIHMAFLRVICNCDWHPTVPMIDWCPNKNGDYEYMRHMRMTEGSVHYCLNPLQRDNYNFTAIYRDCRDWLDAFGSGFLAKDTCEGAEMVAQILAESMQQLCFRNTTDETSWMVDYYRTYFLSIYRLKYRALDSCETGSYRLFLDQDPRTCPVVTGEAHGYINEGITQLPKVGGQLHYILLVYTIVHLYSVFVGLL